MNSIDFGLSSLLMQLAVLHVEVLLSLADTFSQVAVQKTWVRIVCEKSAIFKFFKMRGLMMHHPDW